jgi:hypothetical protein
MRDHPLSTLPGERKRHSSCGAQRSEDIPSRVQIQRSANVIGNLEVHGYLKHQLFAATVLACFEQAWVLKNSKSQKTSTNLGIENVYASPINRL